MIRFEVVWFDSLGAKSSSILVRAGGKRILVDPGVAEMQPSFPASDEMKRRWFLEAYDRILEAGEKADIVTITHYHYDHFMDFERSLYEGKLILAKNPNEYINESQRERAERFYDHLYSELAGANLEDLLMEKEPKSYQDPLENLPIARSKSFGDYDARRKELLEKGRRWFERLTQKWNRWRIIPDLKSDSFELVFSDGKSFEFGDLRIRFREPEFHGIEYARVGWVIPIVFELGGDKLVYSSDLEGPVIEDQAEWIIEENPRILILDGPSTYLIPFMMSLISLRRAVDNLCRILEKADRLELVIYDHHLLRDRKYRERVSQVYEKAREVGIEVLTAAEYLGEEPAVLRADSG